jgi:hypothetical protein
MSDDLPDEFDLVVIGTGKNKKRFSLYLLILNFFVFPGLSESVIAAGK